MIFFKTIVPLKAAIRQLKTTGKTIGFVPTMGALHAGHISLIEESRSITDITICSIFINPMQFNDVRDFEKYPKTIEPDILLLEKSGADIVFMPAVDEIYPVNNNEIPQYELGYLEDILEGFYRPGHFQGVCRVVKRLLDIIVPDILFLGQKDYQQCMVIKKMMNEFTITAQLLICPTLRERSGLAMSSRNLRLSLLAREKAGAMFKALCFIKAHIARQSSINLKNSAMKMITDAGFEKVDYVEICDAETLKPITDFDDQKKHVALAAAFIEGIRLIDNLLLN